MERLLAKLDRQFGRHAPENVILWVVGLSGAMHLLVFARPEVLPLLWLSPQAVLQGEFWRAFTFLFAPVAPVSLTGLIWTAFGLWLLHTMGTALEAQWGSLRFDLFCFAGAIATFGIAFLVGPVSGTWLATALFLAFAAEFPDFEILLLILPVKVKYLGGLSGVLMIYSFITGGIGERAAIAIAIADLLVFCGGTLRGRLRGASRSVARSRPAANVDTGFGPIPRKTKVCAKCGRSSADDQTLEFRVCDCQEKCGGKLTEYCIEHAKNH
jgi:hypothetical protein